MSQKIQGQGGSATLHPPIFGHSPDLVMQPKPPSPWRIAKGSGWSFLECPFISCSRTKTINQLVYLHFYPTTLTNTSSASVCTIYLCFFWFLTIRNAEKRAEEFKVSLIRMPICVPCSWGLEPQLTGRRGNPILIFLRWSVLAEGQAASVKLLHRFSPFPPTITDNRTISNYLENNTASLPAVH